MKLNSVEIVNKNNSYLPIQLSREAKLDGILSMFEKRFSRFRKGLVGYSERGFYYFCKEENGRVLIDIRGSQTYFELKLEYV